MIVVLSTAHIVICIWNWKKEFSLQLNVSFVEKQQIVEIGVHVQKLKNDSMCKEMAGVL